MVSPPPPGPASPAEGAGPVGAAPTRRHVLVAGAVLAVGALSGSACSKDEAAPPTTTPATNAPPATAGTTTTTAPVPTYPLSGLPVTDPAVAARPALVVKIDNVNDLSRPQAGINQADLVFEEKIEGPISRFAAVFHSKDAPELGPVRSGRSTDVAIVSTLNHPLYAFSGANAVFIKQLRAAPLVDIGYDVQPRSYDRKPGRPAPDNVFTSTQRLWALTPPGAGPPPPQLVYRRADEPVAAGAVEVPSFAYSFGGGPVGQPVTYTWDAGRGGWLRTQKGSPHVDADGVQVAPPNVIVQLVPYRDTGLVDGSDTPVPEAVLVGTGDAWVFTDGRAVKATWAKPDDATPTAFRGADGSPVALTPGATWIALVPTGGDFSATRADGAPLV